MIMRKFYIIFAILIANIFYAQTELVRWNQANLAPTLSASNISASNANSGFGIASRNWSESFFEISSIPFSTSIDNSKYLQFSVTPNSNYQITVSSFNFTYRAQSSGQKFEVRYSTNSDFSNPQTLTAATTTDTNWHSLSLSNFTNPIISSGKTIYIRFYIFNGSYNTFHISNGTAGIAPNVTGTVANSTPVVPVANDDSYSVYKNNSEDLNILSNDVSGSSYTGITITQQPTHGTITVNGTTNVTYKPTTGYLGADTFKYKASNATGLSNEATVAINVNEMPPSTLARWNNGNVNPTTYNTNITAGNIITNLVTMVPTNASGPLYLFEGWPSQTTVNTSYYVQFSISPKSGYKLNLSEFNFQCFMTGSSGTMRIDYSLNSNFTNPITLLSGFTPATSEASASTISLNNFSSPVATDGQVVYVRIYVYNTYQKLYIKYIGGSNPAGPAFIGTVSSSATTPVATNDTVTTTENDDIDINVLVNDDYSNIVNSISLSQPSHGTVTLNSDNTVNYLPDYDYIGPDSFTYSITNNYGTSNTATVSITVNPETNTTLIRWDSASAPYYPTSYKSFISASLPITAVGTTLNTGGETLPIYIVGAVTDATINTSKYIEFRLNNTSTTKTIETKNFSFIGRGYNPGNYEIRYSKSSNFSSYQILSAGTYSTSYATISGDYNSVKVEAGETLYTRVYFYKNESSYVIQYYTGSTGPAITGVFYNNVYSNTDTIWQNAAAPYWSNGIPTSTKNAIINTYYNTSINGNFQSKNLTINVAGSLNINDGDYVTVNGQIVNNNSVNTSFTLENNASLVQKNDVQNTGNITYKRIAENIKGQDYIYWSSPVSGQNLNSIYTTPTQGQKYFWNTTLNNGNGNKENISQGNWESANNATMQIGKGYIVRGSSNANLSATSINSSFTGIPNNGNISVNIERGEYTGQDYNGLNGALITNLDDNWNLIGNPYPSAINALQFLSDNKDVILGNVRLWKHGIGISSNGEKPFYGSFTYNYSANDYETINSTGTSTPGFSENIKTGQAFFVQMIDGPTATANVTFNNSQRSNSYSNNNFFRISNKKNSEFTLERNRIWLDIVNSDNVSSGTLIGYVEGATMDNDSNFDAYDEPVGDLRILSKINENSFVIQGRALPFNSEDIVPLVVVTPNAGVYKIAIRKVDGLFENATQHIYLEDKILGTIHDLKLSAYSFSSNQGIDKNRFFLRYTNSISNLNLPTFNTSDNVFAYTNDNVWVKSMDTNIKNIVIYDVLGKKIDQYENIDTNEIKLQNLIPRNNIFILKITLENDKIINKKIIF